MNQIELLKHLLKQQGNSDDYISLGSYPTAETEAFERTLKELEKPGYVQFEKPHQGFVGGFVSNTRNAIITTPADEGDLEARLTIAGRDYIKEIIRQEQPVQAPKLSWWQKVLTLNGFGVFLIALLTFLGIKISCSDDSSVNDNTYPKSDSLLQNQIPITTALNKTESKNGDTTSTLWSAEQNVQKDDSSNNTNNVEENQVQKTK